MKVLLIIFSLIFQIEESNSQKTIKIYFNKESTGDYDLMIKDILIQNGSDAYVDYGNNLKKAHYTVKYETTSRTNYDELKSIKFTLLDSNKNIINVIERSISYFNLGVNEPKEFCNALGKLFKSRFNCKNCNEKSEVKYFNIGFNVHKIDSCTYSIIAKGAGIRPLKDVEEAFLEKAKQYLRSFEYYHESDKYKYSAPGPITTYHKGFEVFGIIKSSLIEVIKPRKLTEKPLEFTKEFENK